MLPFITYRTTFWLNFRHEKVDGIGFCYEKVIRSLDISKKRGVRRHFLSVFGGEGKPGSPFNF